MTKSTANPLQAFEGPTFEVTASSGRTFVMRELSAIEQMNADACAKDGLSATIYYRMAMALVSVNGAKYDPASNATTLLARLSALGGRELDDLTMGYLHHFEPDPVELPKESAPSA